MNKAISLLTISLLLSACITDPKSPFYTGNAANPPAVVDVIKDPKIDNTVRGEVSENTDLVKASQCLSSDVLANATYAVVSKGAKGVIEKSGGKEYFVTGGKRHDFTNVPYNLVSC